MFGGGFGGTGGGFTAATAARPGGGQGEEIFDRAFDPNIMRRFFGFVRPYRWQLLAAIAAVMLFMACQVLIPLAIRQAVNSALAASDDGPLLWALGFFALLVATNYAGSFCQEWVAARLAQRVLFDLRRAMFAHLQHVSLSAMDRTHVGRMMSRLQGDVNALQEFLEFSVLAVGDAVLLVGIVAVLLAINWQLGLLTVLVLPVLLVARIIWLPRIRVVFRAARDASSTVNAALAENINGIRTVQESIREDLNLALYDEKASQNLRAQLRAAWLAQLMNPLVEILTGVALAILVVIGGTKVLNGTLDVGVMVAYIFYVQRFFDPIRSLTLQYTIMQRAMAAGHRIFEVLDVPVEIQDKPGAEELSGDDGSIEFRHVTFGYRPGLPVLHDLSFRVEPGQMVALVGPTGSGKTSITSLVHRFYETSAGAVLVGGRDVRDVTLDSIGRHVTMVLQELFLFTGTVFENIRYNTIGATRDDVIRAAQAVHAHDFIMRLPDGYDTVLGQRGRNLSVGQRQLLSFARAIVADPTILILDEATANIDSFTEREIQAALRVLMQGRTSLVIAHRLATVRHADRIIVLQQGRIVESGTHDELIRQDGLYATLHASNYASFDDLPGDGLPGDGLAA